MSTLSPERRKSRAALGQAAAAASRCPDDPDARRRVEERRREDRYVAARDYVRRVVDEAPPLTDAQRRDLVAILTGAAER